MVNIMYQTSLKQFLEIFDLSMAKSQKSPITTKRINNIIEYLTYAVFAYTARGLYEEHKFLFVQLMTLKIEMAAGRIRMDEFQTFIKGKQNFKLGIFLKVLHKCCEVSSYTYKPFYT